LVGAAKAAATPADIREEPEQEIIILINARLSPSRP
jgi:hypothetical protein